MCKQWFLSFAWKEKKINISIDAGDTGKHWFYNCQKENLFHCLMLLYFIFYMQLKRDIVRKISQWKTLLVSIDKAVAIWSMSIKSFRKITMHKLTVNRLLCLLVRFFFPEHKKHFFEEGQLFKWKTWSAGLLSVQKNWALQKQHLARLNLTAKVEPTVKDKSVIKFYSCRQSHCTRNSIVN